MVKGKGLVCRPWNRYVAYLNNKNNSNNDVAMKFNNEKESVDYFITALLSSGYTDVISTSADTYCRYDVTATNPYNNNRIMFELKNRDCYSYTYNDNMIENDKRLALLERLSHNDYDKVYIINFFNDMWCVSSIDNYNRSFWALCPATTDFDNNEKVLKLLSSFKRQRSFDYD